MNMTVLVGNGIDLHFGLKTRYTDFYDEYLKTKADKPHIEEWKQKIRSDYQLWSDLENEMREQTIDLVGQDLVNFMEFIEDLTEHLSDYLVGENERYSPISYRVFSEELVKALKGLAALSRQESSMTPEVTARKQRPTCTILNYNYTTLLDRVVETGMENLQGKLAVECIHPHGSLSSSLVLGTAFYHRGNEDHDIPESEIDQWIIKRKILEQDPTLQQEALKAQQQIQNSDMMIFIYGMSLGVSGDCWWGLIVDWLLKSPTNRLVIYSHALNGLPPSRVTRRKPFCREAP